MKGLKNFFRRKSKKAAIAEPTEEVVLTTSTPKEWTGESTHRKSPSPFLDTKTETSRATGPTTSVGTRQTSISKIKQERLTIQASDDGSESQTPGDRNVSTETTPPPAAAARLSGDRLEIPRNKGGAESFRKRFGAADTSEHQAGKLCDAYDSIPLLEQTKLPRGGISVETKAVGRIQVRLTHNAARSII